MEPNTAIECTYVYVLRVQMGNVYRGLVVLNGHEVWASSGEVTVCFPVV